MAAPDQSPHGGLPRVLSENLLWTGRCQEFDYFGTPMHSHQNAFLIRGSKKTLLIDTGGPAQWCNVERDVENFLAGRPLDYIFPTHPEFPHGGLLPRWMEKYPDAIAVGNLSDHDLIYPDLVDRFEQMEAGEEIDLGDRQVLFVPALWRDLPTTLWAFDTLEKILFVSDAFAFLHFHSEGQCSLTTTEQPPVDVEMMRFNAERTLTWTQFADARETFPDFDRLISTLGVKIIAPAHGSVVDDIAAMIPTAKEGIRVFKTELAAE